MSHLSSKTAVLWLLAATAATGQWVVAAQIPQPSPGLIQTADSLMADLRYEEAFPLYRAARQTDDATTRIRAGAGAVRALLRLGLFQVALREGAAVEQADPQKARALAIHGDAFWAAGLFFEAEDRYAAALAIDPNDARALHGRGRSLATQQRLEPALSDVRRATVLDPAEPLYFYTLGMIYAQIKQYETAADTLSAYSDLLSKPDVDLATSARTQARFYRSFGSKRPNDITGSVDQVFTVPFRLVDDRMIIQTKVNGNTVDMVVDTGVEHAVLSPAFAKSAGVEPLATLDTAGVGDFGFGVRGMQIARMNRLEIGTFRMNNVACIIASPSIQDMPSPETESFSPLAIGLSMTIDYRRGVMTMARQLAESKYETKLPVRMSRLAIIRGTINGTSPAGFVIDTGSQVTSLSRSVASQLRIDPAIRRVPVKVYGRGGWDRNAFLLPYTDIELARGVGLQQRSVVVLGLDAPSALLGFQLGGVIGHEFLSQYVVSIDLQRSVLGLERQR